MRLKVFLENMTIGIVCIVVFLIFMKVTGIGIPTWLGIFIILGIMSVFNSITFKKAT